MICDHIFHHAYGDSSVEFLLQNGQTPFLSGSTTKICLEALLIKCHLDVEIRCLHVWAAVLKYLGLNVSFFHT